MADTARHESAAPSRIAQARIECAPRLNAHGKPLHPIFGLIIGFGAICLVAVAVHALFAAI